MQYSKLIPDFIIRALFQEQKKSMVVVKKVDGKYVEIDGHVMFKRKDKDGNFQLYADYCSGGGCNPCSPWHEGCP